MNKKFRTALSEKCKDMGLTDKALDELAELGSKGLADDASDEDITKAVDLVVPYAKLMQGEITRKTRKSSTQSSSQSKKEGEDEGEQHDSAIAALIAEQMKPFKEQLDKLQTENDALKAEKATKERNAIIAEKAKALGIPDYLMKRVSFAEDADLDKELADYKQELVNNNLVSKEQAHETGKADEAMKADADAWAKSLPDK